MPGRRVKTYTAQTGFVYEFYFVGKRPALEADAATEYVFDVSNDRKVMFSVSVFLPEAAIAEWAKAHGRRPSDAEQYAAVKMRMLRAFDEVKDMLHEGRSLELTGTGMEEFLGELGVE